MTSEQLDIEQIVREVIRRLAELPSCASSEFETEKPPLRKAPAAKSTESRCRLQLSERVITTALLERRLDGVKQVVVPARAVVTPAVRDMLRKKRITIVDQATKEDDIPCQTSRFLAVVDPLGEFAAATAAVAAELGDVQQWDGDCIVKAVRQVTEAVVEAGDVGIVFTRQPSVALCRANRHARVRAAWGVNVAAVKEAVQSIGANVLIVNPALHGVYELRGILREFASGKHTCPERFRETLEG